MVKLENVLGGSVQFHFNIAEKLRKIVVIAEGITTVYDEDEVLAMLKVWNHLGEALESDKMAVDLVNGFMTKFEEEGETYVEYSYGARDLRCNVRTGQLIED
ncbi:MAG: hypothetical protein ACLT4O_02490 [Clostridia bacterium]